VGSNNPDILYVNQQPASGNIGTLWKSIDGGISWNSCFIPAGNSRRMLLSLDPLNSNNLWIAYPDGSNGFKVFKTSDGGSTWTNLSSSILNNESIQSIVHIPGTDGGIYAATNKAVYYRNNTTNWVIDNAGLPTFTNGNILRPFFRDNKIRLASYGKGIWESQLNETPSFPIARINVDKLSQMGICDLDSFYFEDHSYLNHTNAQWNWTFPTGSPATSTQRNPTVLFNQAGSHLAVLQVTDANGNSDIDSLYVQVSFYTLPTLVQEDFEGNFIPNGWSIDNQDNGSTWTLSSTAGGFGNSSQSALFNNYDYDAQGTFDDLIVNFDASTIASNPYMTYDVAYARWGGGYPDSMAILASTDCGLTYQELYMDGGVTLATAPDIQSFFTPSATQWRKDSINLAAFNGSANLQIAFRSIGKWGNNLYIDNVNLDNQSGMLEPKDEYLSIFPNPIQGDGLLTIKTIPFSKIKIIDMNGKLVQEAKGEGTLTIPLNKLKAGTYMINVESATKIWNKPLIIR
jgi:hypothetical protein